MGYSSKKQKKMMVGGVECTAFGHPEAMKAYRKAGKPHLVEVTVEAWDAITSLLKMNDRVLFKVFGDDTVFKGVLIKPRKLWVEYKDGIADENNITHIQRS